MPALAPAPKWCAYLDSLLRAQLDEQSVGAALCFLGKVLWIVEAAALRRVEHVHVRVRTLAHCQPVEGLQGYQK